MERIMFWLGREGLETGEYTDGEYTGRRVVEGGVPEVDGRGAGGLGDIVKSA